MNRLPFLSRSAFTRHLLQTLLAVGSMLSACPGIWAACPRPLTSSDQQVFGQSASEDGAGGALVSWVEQGGPIRIQRLDSAGNPLWERSGIVVSDSVERNLVASGGIGAALVAWDAGNGWRIQKFSPQGDPLWISNGIPVSEAALPQLISDGAGGAFFVATPTVYHIDAAGTVGWTRTISLACSTGALGLNATAHGTGGIAVLAHFVCGEERVTRAFRLSRNGEHLWGPEGVNVPISSGPVYALAISGSEDGSSLHIVSLENREDKGLRPFVQRLNSEGEPQWGPEGVAAAGEQVGGYGYIVQPAVFSRGAEAFILWVASSTVYAQRLSGSGERLWGEGVLVAPPSGTDFRQAQLHLVSGGEEGVIAAWDAGAQRLDDAGNSLWGPAPLRVGSSKGLVATSPGEALAFSGNGPLWVTRLNGFSCIRRTQSLRIHHNLEWWLERGWQVLIYNYSTGEITVNPYSATTGAPQPYLLLPNEWVGVFLYDYAQGRFTEATYNLLDPLP